jgi:para-aminobenzoate synthetase component 1
MSKNSNNSLYLCAMRGIITIPIVDVNHLADQLCRWSQMEEYSIVLRSSHNNNQNLWQEKLNRYQVIAAFGVEELIRPTNNHFENLRASRNQSDWLFGFLGYDLKNSIEKLESKNSDGLDFPEMLFFRPSIVFVVQANLLSIEFLTHKFDELTARKYFDNIMATPEVEGVNDLQISIQARFSKDEYTKTIENILNHIQRGDIYEMNLCQEFFASPCEINPYETYISLNNISPTPFSAFGRFNTNYLLCASPERYLQKQGTRVVSQPIKGTCPRGSNEEEDRILRENLKTDTKERAENIMIVDLVRNDLSRVAARGSVKVDELCGVYPFRQVNQMISTVSCELNPNFDNIDLLKATFPMGSMTGAPKVSAMKIIENYERIKRGLFSGAVGYFNPQGDFDFNVVIRTILYSKANKYLSFTVGGAITNASIPENEYNECLLKAKAIMQVLKSI